MKKLYLIGAGGHSHSVIDVIESGGNYEILGLFDLTENVGKKVLDYSVIGSDSDILSYVGSETYFLITLGQILSAQPRRKIFEKLKSIDALFATVISSSAYVARSAVIGEGSVVMHHSVVNAGARVGQNCILNTKCLIEHDAVVEDHCHVATGAILNGDINLGEESFIGSGAVVMQGLKIPPRSFIQAGSFANGSQSRRF